MAQGKPGLPQAPKGATGLGRPTIMQAELARVFGPPYVHLAAFSIDIDRLRPTLDATHDWPLGWEVFLIAGAIDALQPEADADIADMLVATAESLVACIDEEERLGLPLLLAVRELSRRRRLPRAFAKLFQDWDALSAPLKRCLDLLWQGRASWQTRLAQACLAAPLAPPLAPPSRQLLERLVAGAP
ncbi:MAG: hypothetical protein ACPGUV_13740 [Polyangiales bacterium]